jgi:hypothetical protein
MADGSPAASGSPESRWREEFLLAHAARDLFAKSRWPIELWIALQMARTEGDLLRRELALTRRAGRAPSLGGLVASLDRVNLLMSRRARELRERLVASGIPLDPVQLELVLAVLLRDGLAYPSRGEIRKRTAEIEAYRPAAEPAASEGLPGGVDEDVLEALRQIEAFIAVLAPVRPKVELWEAFSLAVSGRTPARRAAPGVVGLYGALVDMRQEKTRVAEALRRYVAGLPIGSYSDDTMELAFAFILASPEGCLRARQWIESPERFIREAAIRVEGVIGRAQTYLYALRAVA